MEKSSTLDDLWMRNAHFEFVSKARFPTTPNGTEFGKNVGFHFVPLEGTWYLFHREYEFAPQPSYCTHDYSRIVVRNSTSEGREWSEKEIIVSPVPASPTECATTDGAGFFDEKLVVWHYLGQCLDRGGAWNLCHFSKPGLSPNGVFTPNARNPVVRGGDLWKRICTLPTASCDPTTVDEGTPEIVMKDNGGYFWVTFHGYAYKDNNAYRGVAKTKDFVHWVVSDKFDVQQPGPSLPGDAIFSSRDCNSWNITWAKGGCVGGGEGSITFTGQHMYQLIEAPDVSLGCVDNQNWVLGLLRAPPGIFLPTPQWTEFGVVPTVVPVAGVTRGCYIQYHRLFQDDRTGKTYLEFFADLWMQVYELVPGAGPLPVIAGPPPS